MPFPVEEIDDAIESYPAHIHRVGDEGAGAPYDTASLEAIYAPRVEQLLDLKAEGFLWVQWGHDEATGQNRWFGVSKEMPPCAADCGRDAFPGEGGYCLECV